MTLYKSLFFKEIIMQRDFWYLPKKFKQRIVIATTKKHEKYIDQK